jgi:hypothetical protein
MDEIRELQALRRDVEPDADVVERHRDQLRRSMRPVDAAGSLVGASPLRAEADAVDLVVDGVPGQARSTARRRWPVVAAAAAAVVAIAGGLALVQGDDAVVDVGTVPQTTAGIPATTALAPVVPSESAYLCGEEIPSVLDLPTGFGEPIEDAAPVSAAVPGQRVIHWTDGVRTIEVRWPADPALLDVESPAHRDVSEAGLSVVTLEPSGTPFGGTSAAGLAIGLTGGPEGCQYLQVTASGPEAASLPAIGDLFDFTEDQPLIVGTVDVAAPPTVMECQGPPDLAPPKDIGPVTGAGVHATPEAALEAFLAGDGTPPPGVDQATLPASGYTLFRLPDGTTGVAWGSSPAGSYSVLLTVVPTGSGWTATAIETSGC